MSSEQGTTDPAATMEASSAATMEASSAATMEASSAAFSRWSLSMSWATLIGAVLVFNVIAFILVPPFPKGGQPGDPCSFPVCFIDSNLEFPPPHVVVDLAPDTPMPTGQLVITFHPSITSTILTMWIVAAVVLIVFVAATRVMRLVPGPAQNLVEFAYEALDNFAAGLGGPGARRYVPVYAAFFLLILFCNWSGLIPPIGRINELRAPTSDVNITIGLALVAFAFFELHGFRANGVVGYLAKFFPLYEFKRGIGAGLLALFVGLVELLLEFVKPVTLSMRLFGNIYGGEVALAVMTALTIAYIPVLLYGLEVILNFVQALIFSVLTLMFTIIAVESHQHEEGEVAEEGVRAIHEVTHGEPQPVAAD